ncbi:MULTISPECIES: DUF6901 family protein [unclassified Hahella]|uniref:DUF6901 family protein n=1 Tax=unclassified Hahella TaxID=2624107 RepID=UPI001C1E8FF8|nr:MULTISPECIES: hypothetical protein [unclassified Hahella]MBU6952964.1 hypothetical protein [Hahella sp. HN01]MDG9667669.1 hypothetical protein [Hahella sp. CR1]
MRVRYEFRFDDNRVLDYIIETEREDKSMHSEPPAEWTELKNCQCSNCPLKKDAERYCPAALDMQKIVADFRSEPAFQKVEVTVFTKERNYHKRTGLEEALRSLMGLVMATSHCPILGELRPMAIHHMPFSNGEEFILRSVSIYLVQQYFMFRDGEKPDWELKGLVERNRRLQLVNQALWQRIHSACDGDSNLKALLSFFSLASSVTFSLETQLQKLRKSFESGEWVAPL